MLRGTKKREKEGFIYLISNPSFPGFYKVGVTTDIESRLKTYQTSDPKRAFKIEFYLFHPNVYEAEKKIEQNMKYFALSKKNEWYEIDKQMAINRIQETLEND